MRPMNSIKSAVGPINSSKNKLNGKINWFFKMEPNAHLGVVWIA